MTTNNLNVLQAELTRENIRASSPADLNQQMDQLTAAMISGKFATDPVALADATKTRVLIMERLIEMQTGDPDAAHRDMAALGGQVRDTPDSLQALREQAEAIKDINPEHSARLLSVVAEAAVGLAEDDRAMRRYQDQANKQDQHRRNNTGVALQTDIDNLRELAGREENPVTRMALQARADSDQAALTAFEHNLNPEGTGGAE